MRLIDADELLNKIGEPNERSQKIFMQRNIIKIINNMPVIKQKEEKHGHWDYYGYDEISNVHIYRCSECECGNGEATDYCPYCGANMWGDGR